MHDKALFIFRRDLRLEDNTALLQALEESTTVIPAFIITEQATSKHRYHTSNGLQFMIESLRELEKQLATKKGRLHYYTGKPETVIAQLIAKEHIDAVYVNHDYTPYSKKRDEQIKRLCDDSNIPFIQAHDALLHPPQTILKDNKEPYTVFTPYYRKANTKDIPSPKKNNHTNYSIIAGTHECPLPHPQLQTHKGGRAAAKNILADIDQHHYYDEQRNIPALDRTTKLSPHHKFGTVSARETYHAIRKAFGPGHDLARQLHWRDFFTQIGYHFPRVYDGNFNTTYDNIQWDDNNERFKKWCEGKTGYPIIDAGMRQLNTTGWMHNRVRMVVASFLTKDLHIDWREGERYFATKLVDYDPAVNNGSWQWAASTGCDAQPYFRIFNPWRQQKRFDPQATYIKQWVPELKGLGAQEIHGLEQGTPPEGYPKLLIDHYEEKEETLKRFKKAR